MSTGLVVVLLVAAAVPLVLGLFPRLPLPGPLVEIVAGIVLGPAVLGWVEPDTTIRVLALLGLSFLLFLAGYEIDPRRFRGTLGRRVAASLFISVLLAGATTVILMLAGVRGGAVVGVALLATSLGLIVPVLGEAGALDTQVGRLAIGGATGGEVAAVVVLSVGLASGDTPLSARFLLLGLLLLGLGAIAAVVLGAEHSKRLSAAINRKADASAQIRIRLTVLLVAGLALAAESLGFEAILGAFMAGVLVRALDPHPEQTHPRYPIKLEAVGFGLLVPVFFITSGLTLDLHGLMDQPSALALVPLFVVALVAVRGLPALAYRHDLTRRDLVAAGLLQATSLPFLITASTIGVEMDLLDPATAAGLVAAGLLSVLVFPAVALTLLAKPGTETSERPVPSE